MLMRVGNVLRKWIDLYWDDFDSDMIQKVGYLCMELKTKPEKSLQALSGSLANVRLAHFLTPHFLQYTSSSGSMDLLFV